MTIGNDIGEREGVTLVYTLSLTNPLSHQCFYLSSLFPNIIQKAMMFASLSWDIRFKKNRLILLSSIMDKVKERRLEVNNKKIIYYQLIKKIALLIFRIV